MEERTKEKKNQEAKQEELNKKCHEIEVFQSRFDEFIVQGIPN